MLDEFTEKPIDFQAFNVIKDELYIMFEQQPFRLPAEMTFLLKSLTTLDGVARALDPEYNLVDCAQPFIKSVTVSKQERGSLVGELTKQARDFINFKFNQPSRAELFISRLEQRIEEGEIKFRVRSIESDRALKRVNFALKTLIHGCWSGFTLISGILLIIAGKNGWAVFFLVIAGVGVVIFLRSLLNLSIRERLDRMAEQ
ncbi:ABC-1 [Limnospira maxima CS-328]|uniref:ABC-1 n=1 Tax=Limnospira maxima CS-328 TaxID=513049 RepID=B5W1A0_LIMMA|nr:ABC-1 [Limnospira maxima CS-328]